MVARVNPRGQNTSYYFQYGKSAAYEAQTPAAPGTPLGSDEGDVQVVIVPMAALQGGVNSSRPAVNMGSRLPGAMTSTWTPMPRKASASVAIPTKVPLPSRTFSGVEVMKAARSGAPVPEPMKPRSHSAGRRCVGAISR
jgi:hypothetical protein